MKIGRGVLVASWLALIGCASRGAAPVSPVPGNAQEGLLLSSEPCALPDSDAALAAALMPHGDHGLHGDHGPHGDHGANGDHGPHAQSGVTGAVEPTVVPPEVASLRKSLREGRCRKIRYRSDGLSIAGFILEPPRRGPSPAILVARGGNREIGMIGPLLLMELNALADQGFVIVATQYRGADGSDGQDEFGGADLADLENLVPVARSLPSVDPSNLFLLGYSRGGMMAAMALRRKLPVRAAALFSGLYDLEADLAKRPEMEQNYRELIPGFETNREAELRRRGAVHWAEEIQTPVLILGGTRDWRVDFDANARRLDELLARAGREHKLAAYDDDHALARFRAETTREIADWFRGHQAPAH